MSKQETLRVGFFTRTTEDSEGVKQVEQKILVESRLENGELLVSETFNPPSLKRVIKRIRSGNEGYKIGMFLLGDLSVVPITSTIGILLDVGNVWFQGVIMITGRYWRMGYRSLWRHSIGYYPGALMALKKGRARDRRYKEYITHLMDTRKRRDKLTIKNKHLYQYPYVFSSDFYSERRNILKGILDPGEHRQLDNPFSLTKNTHHFHSTPVTGKSRQVSTHKLSPSGSLVSFISI